MKTFRTVFPIQHAPFSLTYADRLLLAGSCFIEHIGERLTAGKFTTLANPNGIIYNPLSLAQSLEFLLNQETYTKADLFNCNGLWHSWAHHGAFSNPDEQAAANGIQQARETAAVFLEKTNRLLLTLGTAEIFTLRETGQVVANCHKAPAGWFDQRRLGVPETVEALSGLFQKLKAVLPDLQVILTVSPVRHLRNGAIENQRSKAVLLLACAEICGQFDFVYYFPAYELLLDDLRDYRFYAPDMAHPNELAVDYIWQHFAETFFPPDTRQLLAQIEKIRMATTHRPFFPDTPEHRAFARTQLERIEQLSKEHPELDLSVEKTHFQQYTIR